MKLRLLSLLILLLSTLANAQTFQWAKDIKSEGFDEGYDLVTDNNGYVYVAGQIEFLTDFGNGVLIESIGVHDIFLAKYTPAGNLVWARRAGGKGGDKIQSITLDGQGHIFVAGEIDDTAYFENIMMTTGGRGINNMFIGKYDTTGSVMWVRSIGVDGPPHHTRGYGVTTDAQGNVYACGGLVGSANYQGTFLFSSAGMYDGTIYKFDPNGNFCWAHHIGGSDADKAYGIVSDNNGHLYVTGYFAGHVDFPNGISLNGAGHTDMFLAKFDTAGVCLWAKMAGDTGFERGWDVTINVNGDILITGAFQRCRFGTQYVNSRGNEDMFLAAYNSNGDNLWALGGGGVENDVGRGVSHDANGNIYVIGDFASMGYFPPYSSPSHGFADVFVCKYNSSGTAIDWVRTFGGGQNDRGRGVGTDLSGNVYICGEYVEQADLGAHHLTGDLLLDIFVARISPGISCAIQISTVAQNACNGACNGSALALATGQGPFTYNWTTSPPQNTETATGLCAGNYTVTVTDASGCNASATATLTDPPPLVLSTTHDDAICNGACDGEASVLATGNSPFSYSWTTSPAQHTEIATGLCAGSYSVTVTDASGCTTTATAVIADPAPLVLSTTHDNISCSGSCDGEATVAATGQSPFTYSWTTSPSQTTANATGLCSGSYSVMTTDANGCTSSASVNISQPSPLAINANVEDANCIGCSNGNIDVTVGGGSSPYDYLWSNGSTTHDLVNVPAGSYTLCITDNHQCEFCDTFIVSEPTSGISYAEKEKLVLFPNPLQAGTTLHITVPNFRQADLELYNSAGKLIQSTSFAGNNYYLDTKIFKSGIYFLKLYDKTENLLATATFVVE